jgi:hypothetical protein
VAVANLAKYLVFDCWDRGMIPASGAKPQKRLLVEMEAIFIFITLRRPCRMAEHETARRNDQEQGASGDLQREYK